MYMKLLFNLFAKFLEKNIFCFVFMAWSQIFFDIKQLKYERLTNVFRLLCQKNFSHESYYSMYSVFLDIFEKHFFIELQNKTLKTKKLPTSK